MHVLKPSKKKTVIISLMILLTVPILSAHDNSEFDFLGFSEDGKYCAFEVYGEGDLSPSSFSYIYLVNVEKNLYAENPFIIIQDDPGIPGLWQTREMNLQKALPVLKKYGINTSCKGTLVFFNPRINGPVTSQNWSIFDDAYLLELQEIPLNEFYKMFELDLYYGGEKRVLQKDTALLSNRDTAAGYHLLCAWYYYGSIAVIIEYLEDGFEGYNRRQMIVTGKIKTKYLPMQYE